MRGSTGSRRRLAALCALTAATVGAAAGCAAKASDVPGADVAATEAIAAQAKAQAQVPAAVEGGVEGAGGGSDGSGSSGSGNAGEQWQPPHPELEFRENLAEAEDAASATAAFERLVMEATKVQADDMLLSLERFYAREAGDVEKAVEAPAVQRALKAVKGPITIEALDQLTPAQADAETRRRIASWVEGYYQFRRTELGFVPYVDYERIFRFEARFSDAMQAYLALQAAESARPATIDGTLLLTREELENRVVASEAHLANFPDAAKRADVERLFVHYMRMYLFGLPGSPLHDGRTLRLAPATEAEFAGFVAERPQSVAGRLVFEYLNVLKEADGRLYVRGEDGALSSPAPVAAFRTTFESRVEAHLSPDGETVDEAAIVYGDWVVSRAAGATPASTMTPEEQEAWIGISASYAPKRATFGEEVEEEPAYEPFVLTDSEFLRSYQVTLEALGLDTLSPSDNGYVQGVRIVDWLAPGSLLFVASEERLVTLWDGVFFELVKR
ncbi:hypothetical protein MO973_43575 [Paenibacillus sp. TRM 82003]|nr:hypothetical protein [Paenibacillus sp. TRM 82003]